MYRRELQQDGQTLRLVITASHGNGWEVREERDGQLVCRERYHDWNRVEFARAAFRRTAQHLRDSGWIEVS